MMDDIDRQLLNYLQQGLPVCERPFVDLAEQLGCTEDDLLQRVKAMLNTGILTRFGPMFDVEKFGGAYTLAAMRVPARDLDKVAAQVNAYPEVAHNYERDHEFNLWFVLGCTSRQRIDEVLQQIRARTRLDVYDMPKLREYFVGLRFTA